MTARVSALVLVLLAASGVAWAQEAAQEPAQDATTEAPASDTATPSAPSGPVRLPESLTEAVGTWDMALDASNRRCTLTLAAESGPNGRLLRFPAGCRRALPILTRASGWMFADKGVRIVDASLRPLLTFEPTSYAGSLSAKAETGERYSLLPLQIAAQAQPGTEPTATSAAPSPDLTPAASPMPLAAPAGRDIPGAPPILRADALVRVEVGPGDRPTPGVYALDRFSLKDVCRLSFEARPAPPLAADTSLLKPAATLQTAGEGEVAPVRILPECRDNGIAVFDPVSWSFANGRLTLKAKRGHAVNLVFKGDGRWRRDPDVGTTLELRKVEP